jgi:hypothetical protein
LSPKMLKICQKTMPKMMPKIGSKKWSKLSTKSDVKNRSKSMPKMLKIWYAMGGSKIIKKWHFSISGTRTPEI